jgi:hypothetical protein
MGVQETGANHEGTVAENAMVTDHQQTTSVEGIWGQVRIWEVFSYGKKGACNTAFTSHLFSK